jgi:hypothetical protein
MVTARLPGSGERRGTLTDLAERGFLKASEDPAAGWRIHRPDSVHDPQP